MGDEDKGILGECTGVLLPLGLQKVVQDQTKGMDYRRTLHNQSAELSQQIFLYLSKFKNTGVEILYGDI